MSRDPRNFRCAANKAVRPDLLEKIPGQTILEQFRSLLRRRQDSKILPPSGEEIVRFYEIVLSELTFNSKPLITDLTIIAGEQREHGQGIADAICSRILEVPVEQKLPSLYLLDSIVKNIGQEYVRFFSSRLPKVFCEAYRQISPNMHPSMRHLFRTWSTLFLPSVLRKIEVQLDSSDLVNYQSTSLMNLRTSELSRPACGSNIIPRYIHKLEKPDGNNNTQHATRPSSNSKFYEQKSSIGYEEYDYDNAEVLSSEIGAQRLSSSGNVRNMSSTYGANKLFTSSTARLPEPLSPFSLGPDSSLSPKVDEFAADSPGTFVERGSASHKIFDYGLGRLVDRDKEMSGWQGRKQYETSAGYTNGRDHHPARALIDAYGNDSRLNTSNAKARQIGRLNMNDRDSNVASWQNSEEEEFDWEEMSPTSADHGRNHAIVPASYLQPQSYMTRPGSDLLQASKVLWPPENTLTSHLTPFHHIPSQQNHIRSRLDMINASNMAINQGPNGSMLIPDQHLDGFGNKVLNSTKRTHGGLPQNLQGSSLPPHFLRSHEARANDVQSASPSMPSHLVAAPLTHGYIPQGHGAAINTLLSNPMPGLQLPLQTIANSSLQLHRGALRPLPPGPSHTLSQLIPTSQGAGPIVSNQPRGSAYSGLINTLMVQGLISVAPQAHGEDPVGIEFDPDILKVPHESAINALYVDLPRQCTTCGVRFKCQEEHSSHMDWHVTRNRMSKTRKQKLSRKWFVPTSMWLRGAEAVGTEAVPVFLPTETEEKKDDNDLAVIADEDQKTCALCGEPFEDFYSDETEEWMYKGAIYLNAPNGSTTTMDRSQLGPIVHDKCRSEPSVISPGNFKQDGEGTVQEGSQMKRMRLSL